MRRLLTEVKGGTGRVLVLRGEAGIGKTALLEHLVGQAAGFRVSAISGVESEMELAFAGLQQLCAPMLAHLDGLPEPQRDALMVAFGRGHGPAPDRFLVGLAVLSLFAAATEAQPLLCVIDDAQWLDQVSMQTLGFVARRLLAEPVGLVFAARDDGNAGLAGLPELPIDGLSVSESRALLASVTPGGLDPGVRDRVVAETRGNPLALLEVPRTISAADLAGGFGHAAVRLSAGRVEDGFLQRIKLLPKDTRRLLLVAAAEPIGDAALFLRACERLGLSVDALAPAEAAGIIELGPRIRFRHPVVRSAAYRAAEAAERREIHRALAEATDADTDPDRRAWHAATAASGPDDEVARELEESAWRAQGRGGVAAAAAFLERAAVLTADPALRGGRAIAAAQVKRDSADPEAARELLAMAELNPLTTLQLAQVDRLRAQMAFTRSRGGGPGAPRLSEAAGHLLDAARRLEDLDAQLSRETYVEAMAAAMFTSRMDPGALTAIAEAARAALDRAPQPRRPIDLLLSGMADRIVLGAPAGAPQLRESLAAWCDAGGREHGRDWYWMSLAFPIIHESAAGELWDDDLAHRLAAAMVRATRGAGALALLPAAIACRAGVHILAGELADAVRLMDEAEAISAAIGNEPLKYHKVELVAWLGNLDQTLSLVEAGTAEGERKGEGRLLAMLGYVQAVLYNGHRRYAEALVAARRACGFDEPGFSDFGFDGWCLVELIEAAVHTGDRSVAEWALGRLEGSAGVSGTDWGMGTLACARAMLADGDAAEGWFTEAVERLGRTQVRIQLARTHLRYGEWLRRMNRRVEARVHLNVAHEMFTDMGAAAFADRARRELAGSGEKVRRQPVGSGAALTGQEAQIAQLARDGLTNQEIGAQLYLSTHTVEWHLRKVFAKLGINSRRQLRTVQWAG